MQWWVINIIDEEGIALSRSVFVLQAWCSSSEVFTTTLGIADYVQVKDDATFSSKR